MGWLGRLLGLGNAMGRVAEVFVDNKTKAGQRADALRAATLHQLGAEFASPARSWFDHLIDGLNRLPRPCLALGTLGLFVYAMADPIGFAARMQGLALVPDQLWWLLGAIVSFYFGARELHHFRSRTAPSPEEVRDVADGIAQLEGLRGRLKAPAQVRAQSLPASAGDQGRTALPVLGASASRPPEPNAALEEWRAQHRA
ncbi:MAG: holin family protein [Pseudomonadota bacterium]